MSSAWQGSIGIVLRSVGPALVTDLRFEPLPVLPIVRGRRVEEAAVAVRHIHAFCGWAHDIALRRAVEALARHPPDPSREAARDRTLAIERTVAHARRVALELAPCAGGTVPLAELKAVLDHAAIAAAAWCLDQAVARPGSSREPPDSALERLEDAFARLLARAADAPPADRLHRLPTSLRSVVVEGWQRPWRFAAERALTEGGGSAPPPIGAEAAIDDGGLMDGPGRGTATTSRGLLTYSVEIEQGRLSACSIDTPTARLVAPGGELETALRQIPATSDVGSLADLVVCALDPCLPWTIDVVEPAHA